MKRRLIAIIGTLVLLASLVSAAVVASPDDATRDLPVSATADTEFAIEIDIEVAAVGVLETLPAGFSFVADPADPTKIKCTEISGMAAATVGSDIATGLFTFLASPPASFKYWVKAPSTAVTGATFSGILYDLLGGTSTVGGDTTMNVGVGVHYTLTMAVSPSGGGTTTPSVGMHSYAAGTSVTLTAAAASGYDFSYWSGAASGTSSTTSVTMDANKSVTANFVVETTPPPAETFAWWIYETFIGPYM